jgi:formate hydrogenlyase transcriptional activator
MDEKAGTAPATTRDRSNLLLEINAAIISHAELPELLRAVSACLRREITHDFAAMCLYDPRANILRMHAMDFAAGNDFVIAGEPVPLDGTANGLVFRTRRPILRDRVDTGEFPSEITKQILTHGLKACCLVPMASHGRTLGTLSVGSKREGAFTERDLETLIQIAGQVAIAVESALSYQEVRIAQEQLKKSRDKFCLLLRVNNALVSQRDLHGLLTAISKNLHEVLNQDFAGLTLYDAETKQYHAVVLEGFRPGEEVISAGTVVPIEGTIGGLAITSGKPVYVSKADTKRFPSEVTRRFFDRGFQTLCAIPLVVQDRTLGVVYMGSTRENALSKDDIELFEQVAHQIALAVDNAMAYREIERLKNKLSEEKLYLEDEIRVDGNFEEIIGESSALRNILRQIERVAPTDSTILIRGETGTGKELIARAIHNLSARRNRTLVKVNCAAIPMGLLESELFGHERGAFTGAISQRIGRFELAHQGSLFLDEVGDIPLELQPKLLRVLQEQQFERLGSTRTQQVDVRLIAATNVDLETLVADREYRSDLYYRLNVFPVTIPPLRERREDIPLLVRFFAQRFARRMKKPIESISAKTSAALTQYHWPGNVRELENVIERAVILSQGPELTVPLTELKLPPEPVTVAVSAAAAAAVPPVSHEKSSPAASTLESVERDHILRVLEEVKWVVAGPGGAAAKLGMKRTTLQAKMRKLGISRR